jgi:hypothetical protein
MVQGQRLHSPWIDARDDGDQAELRRLSTPAPASSESEASGKWQSVPRESSEQVRTGLWRDDLTLTRHEQNALVRLKSPYTTLSIPLNDFTPITMSKINQPSNQIK